MQDDSQFEVVVGQLENLNPARALDAPNEIDYIELEYSARMGQRNSFELSIERMTEANFLRAEYRYQMNADHLVFAEWVKRAANTQSKVILGLKGEFTVWEQPIEYFSYYSYVSDRFSLETIKKAHIKWAKQQERVHTSTVHYKLRLVSENRSKIFLIFSKKT